MLIKEEEIKKAEIVKIKERWLQEEAEDREKKKKKEEDKRERVRLEKEEEKKKVEEVRLPQMFDGTSSRVSGFLEEYRKYIREKMKGVKMEDQIYWVISYVQGRSTDEWKEKIVDEIFEDKWKDRHVEEILKEIEKEFERKERKKHGRV